jgi:hypothetical protein
VGGKVERWLFGDENTPGALGTGQFKPKGYEVDRGAANITGYEQSRGLLSGGAGAATGTAAAAQGRAGPQIAMGPQEQFRQGQMGLMAQLQAQASGQGPSLAQMQLQQAGDRNLANAAALGASQRGAGVAGALRGIASQQAGIGQQLAADSAMMRLQEQQQAQGLLAGVLGGARGQDIGLATGQAGMDLQQRQLNDQRSAMYDQLAQSYLKMGLDLDQAQMRARMDMERLLADQNLGMEQLRSGGYADRARMNIGMLQGAAQMAAGAPKVKPDVSTPGGG